MFFLARSIHMISDFTFTYLDRKQLFPFVIQKLWMKYNLVNFLVNIQKGREFLFLQRKPMHDEK